MPDLAFAIESAEAVPFAAAPILAFKMRVTNASAVEQIQAVMLRCQIQIDATRRRYTPDEQRALLDLFGEPDRWSSTLRPLLWTHLSVAVPAFAGQCLVDLQVPCTFDFNVAATKYFHGVVAGDIPLIFLFSGTVFYDAQDGLGLQVAPISWSAEAKFRMPVHAWHDVMDHYHPNTAWLALRQDVFDRLYEFKRLNGIPTWEAALERLLMVDSNVVPS